MTTPARLSDERLRQIIARHYIPSFDEMLVMVSEIRAYREAESRAPEAGALKPLTSRERHKGTGDVLKDLAHAQRMTDTSEPGFGEVICRGKELDFVNRALRAAVGEIKQLRLRVKPAAPQAARAQTCATCKWLEPSDVCDLGSDDPKAMLPMFTCGHTSCPAHGVDRDNADAHRWGCTLHEPAAAHALSRTGGEGDHERDDHWNR